MASGPHLQRPPPGRRIPSEESLDTAIQHGSGLSILHTHTHTHTHTHPHTHTNTPHQHTTHTHTSTHTATTVGRDIATSHGQLPYVTDVSVSSVLYPNRLPWL